MKFEKKILSLLFAAVMLLSITAGISLSVYAETSGDGNYEYEILDDGTIEIIEYHGAASNITIPNMLDGKTVASIGDGAFSNCTSLKSITIPSSVTSIGNSVFSACVNLKDITVASDNNNYTSANGVLYNKNQTELITYPAGKTDSAVTIPDGVQYIGNFAFLSCGNITSISIPDSVTGIGNSAFYYCQKLTSITIPNSVTSLGSDAFHGCRSLKSITIPNSVTSIGDYTFSVCTNLTSVTIPDSVTSIGAHAFEY
ncbi:MAG: leucine-rich repeat domain-containing protein, partial [Eubacterium sp.]|nr:leucine-rich repeat domain-containing protein [Eubacterium sp.]